MQKSVRYLQQSNRWSIPPRHQMTLPDPGQIFCVQNTQVRSTEITLVFFWPLNHSGWLTLRKSKRQAQGVAVEHLAIVPSENQGTKKGLSRLGKLKPLGIADAQIRSTEAENGGSSSYNACSGRKRVRHTWAIPQVCKISGWWRRNRGSWSGSKIIWCRVWAEATKPPS